MLLHLLSAILYGVAGTLLVAGLLVAFNAVAAASGSVVPRSTRRSAPPQAA
jgi:hypothetical protein